MKYLGFLFLILISPFSHAEFECGSGQEFSFLEIRSAQGLNCSSGLSVFRYMRQGRTAEFCLAQGGSAWRSVEIGRTYKTCVIFDRHDQVPPLLGDAHLHRFLLVER